MAYFRCFRHNLLYPGGHGNGDVYFAARCRALGGVIQLDENEIASCEWRPVLEFVDDEAASPFSRQIVRLALDSPHFRKSELSTDGPYKSYYALGAQLYHSGPPDVRPPKTG